MSTAQKSQRQSCFCFAKKRSFRSSFHDNKICSNFWGEYFIFSVCTVKLCIKFIYVVGRMQICFEKKNHSLPHQSHTERNFRAHKRPENFYFHFTENRHKINIPYSHWKQCVTSKLIDFGMSSSILIIAMMFLLGMNRVLNARTTLIKSIKMKNRISFRVLYNFIRTSELAVVKFQTSTWQQQKEA